MKKSVWSTIIKVIIAVATAIAGALGINPVFSNFQFQLSWVRFIVSTRITGGQPPCNSLLGHTI